MAHAEKKWPFETTDADSIYRWLCYYGKQQLHDTCGLRFRVGTRYRDRRTRQAVARGSRVFSYGWHVVHSVMLRTSKYTQLLSPPFHLADYKRTGSIALAIIQIISLPYDLLSRLPCLARSLALTVYSSASARDISCCEIKS